MRRTRRVVDEERPVRRDRLLVADPLDGLVGDVVVEVVVRLAEVWLDGTGAVECGRPPLVGLRSDEPIEVLEAEIRRPEAERPGLARLPVRHVVVLAEPRGVPSVLLQDLRDRRGVLAHQAVVAGITRRHFSDDPGVHRVMVATGDERRARWRAERGRVELRVAQAILRQPFQRRRGHRPAKGARCAVADVVEQDQQDVGRTFRRLHGYREVGDRVLHAQPDLALERRRRRRQHLLRVGRAARERSSGEH